MKKIEFIISVFSIIALGLNLFLIPGGAILTILALSALSVFYLYLSFVLFNDINLTKIFRKDSYKGKHPMNFVGAIVSGYVLSMTIIGILFKFQLYPGATFILEVSLAGLLILTIIGAIKYFKLH
jgi:hypothetical protein